MQFVFTVTHIPGKDLTIADMLSRAPIAAASDVDTQFSHDVEMLVNTIMSSLPATEQRLTEIAHEQNKDKICKQLIQYCQSGWPSKHQVPQSLKPYYFVSAELTIQQDLLICNNRIVIPSSLHSEMLENSTQATKESPNARVQQSVWWPGLSKRLEELVTNCSECYRNRSQNAEPLMPTPFPKLPWQKVGSDLFVWKILIIY